jgi:hypothetical protein
MREYQLSERHTALLLAALSEPTTGASAFRRWRQHTDAYHADGDEGRLLPIVAARLSEHADDIDLPRMTGQRRHTMVTNHVKASTAVGLQTTLEASGIPSLFFKGLALLPHYASLSMRSMADADLLVPWQQRHEALSVAFDAGFRAAHYSVSATRRLFDDHFRSPGVELVAPNGTPVDLHPRPLHELAVPPEADAALFDLAERSRLKDLALTIAHPAHHLVLLLGHGLRCGSGAQLMALVDVAQLLATSSPHPDVTVALAATYERVATVDAGLRAMRSLLDSPHPDLQTARDHADQLLDALPRASRRDRAAHRARTRDDRGSERRVVGVRTSDERTSFVRRPLEAARVSWELERQRQVPQHALWIAGRRNVRVHRHRQELAPGDPLHPFPDVPPVLTPDHPVRLTGEHAQPGALGRGWAPAGLVLTWSIGREASIWFDMPQPFPIEGTELIIPVVAYVTESMPTQQVSVRLNGHSVATWDFTVAQPTREFVVVPPRALWRERNHLLLVVADPRSPRRAGASDDIRQIGVSVDQIMLSR